jgi:hypothetical protein
VTLDRVEKLVSRGSLRALLHCTIAIGDISLSISGIQLIRDATGWMCRSPQYRGSDGTWRESLQMPQRIWDAVLELTAEQVSDEADPRNAR